MEPWLFTALWTGVGFFVIFLVLVSTSEPLNDVRAERDLALLDEFRAKDSSTKVVIIGNSKLRYATFPENGLDEVASSMGLGAAFVRLLSNNAAFEHFDYALDKLLDLQPDIIVIQAPSTVWIPTRPSMSLFATTIDDVTDMSEVVGRQFFAAVYAIAVNRAVMESFPVT